jgi:hypothetical protein
MDIENLTEGMVIKNYKRLCELLDWEVATSNSKLAQFKELNRVCTYHKEGQKIIIDNILEDIKEKEDLRKYNSGSNTGHFKQYEELIIKQSEYDNIGIYYILKDNDIYIGSTINGFRHRFREHYNGYDELMKHTYQLLQNGGSFNILSDMTCIEDEVLIRQVENEYIQYFINNTGYNVINKKENAYSVTERIRPLKNKNIKIREDKYEKAMQLLIDNGLIDLEDNITPADNYILNGIIQNNFDINNMPF